MISGRMNVHPPAYQPLQLLNSRLECWLLRIDQLLREADSIHPPVHRRRQTARPVSPHREGCFPGAVGVPGGSLRGLHQHPRRHHSEQHTEAGAQSDQLQHSGDEHHFPRCRATDSGFERDLRSVCGVRIQSVPPRRRCDHRHRLLTDVAHVMLCLI